MHIPKTAGTTLRTLVQDEFATAEVFPALLWRDVWEKLGCEERPALHQRFKNSRQYGFVSGHFGYDLDGLFLSRSLRRFTMLREPSHRALSFYHHLRANPSITFYVSDVDQALHELPTPVPELPAVLEHPHLGTMFNNIQTRYLAVAYDPFEIFDRYRAVPHHAPDFSYELIGVPLDRRDLRTAERRLSGMSFGLQEFMTVSQWLIFHELGLNNVALSPETRLMTWGDYQRVGDLAEPERLLLQAHNRLDEELYQFAKTLFLNRVNALAPSLGLAPVDTIEQLSDGARFAESLLSRREGAA